MIRSHHIMCKYNISIVLSYPEGSGSPADTQCCPGTECLAVGQSNAEGTHWHRAQTPDPVDIHAHLECRNRANSITTHYKLVIVCNQRKKCECVSNLKND